MTGRGPYVALALALGCGPSYTVVYEGDARFEHCYALEQTPTASIDQKALCWKVWTQRNTYGQTRDRVEYAASRYRLLTAVQLPTDEGMEQAAPGFVDTTTSLAAPTPTSAFAPPPVTSTTAVQTWGAPPVLTTPAPTSTAAPPPATTAGPKPPGAECLAACESTWQSCQDAKPKCDRTYGTCVGTCFPPKR